MCCHRGFRFLSRWIGSPGRSIRQPQFSAPTQMLSHILVLYREVDSLTINTFVPNRKGMKGKGTEGMGDRWAGAWSIDQEQLPLRSKQPIHRAPGLGDTSQAAPCARVRLAERVRRPATGASTANMRITSANVCAYISIASPHFVTSSPVTSPATLLTVFGHSFTSLAFHNVTFAFASRGSQDRYSTKLCHPFPTTPRPPLRFANSGLSSPSPRASSASHFLKRPCGV